MTSEHYLCNVHFLPFPMFTCSEESFLFNIFKDCMACKQDSLNRIVQDLTKISSSLYVRTTMTSVRRGRGGCHTRNFCVFPSILKLTLGSGVALRPRRPGSVFTPELAIYAPNVGVQISGILLEFTPKLVKISILG